MSVSLHFLRRNQYVLLLISAPRVAAIVIVLYFARVAVRVAEESLRHARRSS